MIDNWHTEVRREYAGLDARFELPIRPLGWARVIGLGLVGLGVFFAWSPALDVWQTVRALLDGAPGETGTFLGLFQTPSRGRHPPAVAGFEWDGKPWMPTLFIAAFWVFGLGLLAVAVNMGRRTGVIAVEDGRLQVETRGLFGVRRQEWNPGELSAVRADACGLEVNERPVLELQIHPTGGKKWGFRAGRDENELRWMAACLRRALNLPARLPHPEGAA